MANNKNKKPAVQAPVVEKPTVEEAAAEQPATVQMPNTGVPSGLSQDAKVQYAAVLQHRKDEMLKNGGENANKYVALTMIEDGIILDIAVSEAIVRKNPAGIIFCANEKNWTMLQELAKEMGVTIPEFKSLPKPTKEQLAAAGLEAAPGQVVLALEEKHVSAETKKKVQHEAKLNEEAQSGKKEYLNDPTKIETDEQLKEALGFQLSNSKIPSPLDRLIQSANFLRAYRDVIAKKSDNPEAEHTKNKELSIADLLQDISTMVPASFTAAGFGKLLCKTITDSQSIVPAFELLKRCGRKRNSSEFKYSNEEIAAMVRVLVVWKASAAIAEFGKEIERLTKKDAKKNADAIAAANENIKKEQEFMSYVTDPKFDLADNFLAAYNDKENPLHKSAIAAAKSIIETHYKDADVPELEVDSLLLNVQQHIGMDLNLFNSIDLRRDDYSTDNLIEFKQKEKPVEEPAEGESKNA